MDEHRPQDKAVLRTWYALLIIAGAVILLLSTQHHRALSLSGSVHWIALSCLAFVAEYVDSSLGMGYGTTLTPLLMLLGFSPLEIVPCILFSECLSGLFSGAMHHGLGNVNLGKGTRARKTAWALASCSVLGTLLAVVLAIHLPKRVVKLYIGAMILGIGLFILLARQTKGLFSWKRIMGLGSLAAFNKGISGGGYGPLLTGGQILSGVPEKDAVGITSLAEGVVCMVGLGLYVALQGWPAWHLALPLAAGALCSVPAATFTVRWMPEHLLRRSIGYATAFLGALILFKAF